MRKMKVLMFGWEFPPHISGGLGTACYGLTQGLVYHGVEVLFVVPKLFGDEDKDAIGLINASDVFVEKRSGASYYEILKNLQILGIQSYLRPYLSPEEFKIATERQERARGKKTESSMFQTKFEFSGKYGLDLFEEVARYAFVAAKVADTNTFDIIHAHDWLTYPAGLAAKAVSGKPLVIHVHATEFDRSGEHVNQEVYNIERDGMTGADKIIAVSNYTRNIIINRYGIAPEKVIAIHNAVMQGEDEPLRYQKVLKEKIVTFLGRVTFQKGPDYFVEAAYKVLQKDNNVRFVMAGSGDMLNKIIRRVAELRISSKFHFTGFLKGDEVDQMFALSDVYVMPSVSEPFGISPLEAIQSNVPVIISRQSGVAEILHHAIKVDFWDIDAIADSMYGLLHYPALSKMFRKFGKREVENLKWDNVGHHVKNVYQQLLNL